MNQKCNDCGKAMVPGEFNGTPPGTILDGEVWMICPNYHRGNFRPAEVLGEGEQE